MTAQERCLCLNALKIPFEPSGSSSSLTSGNFVKKKIIPTTNMIEPNIIKGSLTLPASAWT